MSVDEIRPLFGRVLIKPLEEEDLKGIIIPPSAQEEATPEQGEVVALGTGGVDKEGREIKFTVKVGDKVFFKKYSPDEVKVGDETYLIIDEVDILAVVK